jgi:hypothetical protein
VPAHVVVLVLVSLLLAGVWRPRHPQTAWGKALLVVYVLTVLVAAGTLGWLVVSG